MEAFDGRVTLREEDHVYFVDGRCDRQHISTSALLHEYFEPFDAAAMSRASVHSRNWPESVYRVRAESRALAQLCTSAKAAFVPPGVLDLYRCFTGHARGDAARPNWQTLRDAGAASEEQLRALFERCEPAICADVVQQWNEARDEGTLMHSRLGACRPQTPLLLCG